MVTEELDSLIEAEEAKLLAAFDAANPNFEDDPCCYMGAN